MESQVPADTVSTSPNNNEIGAQIYPTIETSATLTDCLLNNAHKLDYSRNVCVVDLSYLTYTRYFAVRGWYFKAHPDKVIPPDYNWTQDSVFMEKFHNLFTKKLLQICKNKNVPVENIVFAIDCRHVDNWRTSTQTTYKETRKDSHTKNNFRNFDIFPYIRKTVIRNMQETSSNLVMKHRNLEADDLVAIFIEYLLANSARCKRAETDTNGFTGHIYILANDKDYIQICNDRVHLLDLSNKDVGNAILTNGGSSAARHTAITQQQLSGQDYLIMKILCGDVSDNIPPCYVNREFLARAGINTIRPYLKATQHVTSQLLQNSETYSTLKQYIEACRTGCDVGSYNITKDNQFVSNLQMADFKMIPAQHRAVVVDTLNRVFGFS
jgi:5'-3' exonuclease